MESTPRLYDTLGQVLGQHRKWLDRRHLTTLAWMKVGLRQSNVVSLTAWAPYVRRRAVYAQSLVRRCDRWLQKQRIDVHRLDGPLIQQALAEWGHHVLSRALDTSLLWDTYCGGRIALMDRGRAIPLVWQVLHHQRSSVAYDVDKDLLDKGATLLPLPCKVVFRADRGFADTQLRAHLRRLDWPWRIRIQSSCWIERRGHRPCKVNRITWSPGEANRWPAVYMTKNRYGPLPLALARSQDGKE